MARVFVITDSCASIPEQLSRELDITTVPYYIHRGAEVLRDMVNTQRDAFYRWLRSARTLPKTAAPGPGDYLAAFRSLAERGVREIISVHMTSKGSAAYQAALSARDMIRESIPEIRIDIIDTLNVAMCHGWLAIEAARRALKGFSLDEIDAALARLIPHAQMIQTADTLRYLYLGGRIGRAQRLMGSLLNIKPLIGMKDGVIVPLGKSRSRRAAYLDMVAYVERAASHFKGIRAAFVHVAARAEAERLREMLSERLPLAESLIAELSPALGVHSGPGTTGICFIPVLSDE